MVRGLRWTGSRMSASQIVLAGIVVVAGLLAGLSLTAVFTRGNAPFGRVSLGPWQFSPRAGAADVDPYTRAETVVRGALPLGIGEGIAMSAQTDSAGQPLSGACRYMIEGDFPAARFWTLALYHADGRPIEDGAPRHAVTSAEVLRSADGGVRIAVSPSAMAGTWLRSGPGALRLILRLYDTPLSASATTLRPKDVPQIRRLDCE